MITVSTPTDLFNSLKIWAQAHHPLVCGTSVQGRPIYGWALQEGSFNTVNTLLVGAFHGDEPESAQLVAQFLMTHDSQTDVKPTLCIPVLNPDGLLANTRTNANGVDLNRNYPTKNWTEPNTDDKYFGGNAPASEPETQWLMSVIEQYPPQQIISIHTPYREINIDGPARPLAEAIAAHNHYPITEDIGYETPGSFGTYYGLERKIPIMTLELPDDEPFDTTWNENEPALLAALRF